MPALITSWRLPKPNPFPMMKQKENYWNSFRIDPKFSICFPQTCSLAPLVSNLYVPVCFPLATGYLHHRRLNHKFMLVLVLPRHGSQVEFQSINFIKVSKIWSRSHSTRTTWRTRFQPNPEHEDLKSIYRLSNYRAASPQASEEELQQAGVKERVVIDLHDDAQVLSLSQQIDGFGNVKIHGHYISLYLRYLGILAAINRVLRFALRHRKMAKLLPRPVHVQ